MKSKLKLLFIVLSMGQLTHAQYFYWNNYYEEIGVGPAAGTKLYLDTVQGNFAAISVSWDGVNTGFEMRTVNNEGLDLGEVYVAGAESTSGNYGFGNQFFAKPLDGGYIYCATAAIPDCEYSETAILHKINADYTTGWYKKFDEWHEDCSSWSGSNMVKVMPDGRIFLSSYHYFDADTTTTATWDYNGYRFTTLDMNGNVLSDSLHIIEDEFAFHFVNGVVLNDSIVLLAGSLSTIPFEDSDTELLFIKVNVNDGSFGEYYSFPPNDNLACGGWPTTALRPDGKVNVFYHYCEDQDGLDWSIFTPHLMLFDPIEMQPVWDEAYYLPEWDDQAEGLSTFVTQTTSDGGTISAIDLEGSDYITRHFLLKTQASGDMDWYHQYLPPLINDNTAFNQIYDIIEAPDSSGYVVTGEVSDENWIPYHWMYRTDPCGELVWVDCGVGTGELQPPDMALHVWPNPAISEIKIESAIPISTLEIIDVTGRRILKSQPNSTESNLNLEALSIGCYFLNVTLENESSITRKFLKE